MKKTKKQKISIIIHFVLYFLLTIVLILFFINNTLPKLKLIELDKKITKDLSLKKKEIEKKGISFENFKNNTKDSNQNNFKKQIIKNIKKDFFKKNLINNGSGTYISFLKNKNIVLNNIDIKEKNDKILKILPLYSSINIKKEGLLTDYRFINYIEAILNIFNLKTDSSIGIGRIDSLKEFNNTYNDTASLNGGIYSIPLNLSLKGKKKNIVNFLYFIENVGNLDIKNNSIINYYDNIFYTNLPNTFLGGDNQNIFNNQIIDIDKISIKEYIDSSTKQKYKLENIRDFIIRTQANNDFQIDVSLLFYVKGLPIYEIRNYIITILNNYKKTFGNINKKLKKTKPKGNDFLTLSKHNNILKNLNKEYKDINKNIKNTKALESLYERAIILDRQILPISKIYE